MIDLHIHTKYSDGNNTVDEIVITNATDKLIPTAVSELLDTPINGHIPKNLLRTILLTNAAPKKSSKKCSIIFHLLFYHLKTVFLQK